MENIKRAFPYFILLNLLFYSFNSCEYDSDDSFYYSGIEKPKDIQIDINLANVNASDTIYIYASTRLFFSVSGENKQIVEQKFHLDGANITQDSNYIFITPNEIDGRIRTLTYDVTFKSGSGSIADITGSEVFKGHYEYILKYVSDARLDLNLRQSKTPDGYLKLEWDAPNLKQTKVVKYELSFTNPNTDISLSSIITLEPEVNSYIDKNYAYGYKLYKLKVYFEDERIDTWQSYHTAKYTPITNNDWEITETGTDGLNISWIKNDFNCNYVLQLPDGRAIYPGKNTSIDIKVNPLPFKYSLFKLYILPEGEASIENIDKSSIVGYWYGSSVLLDEQYKYLADQKYIYAITNHKIRIYDTNFNYIEEKEILPTINLKKDKVFCSYEQGKRARIVVQQENNLYIYNYDNNYKNPIQITGPGYTDYKLVTINSYSNALTVIPNASGLNTIYTYDINNPTNKNKITLSFSNPSIVISSSDGKTIVETNGTIVYKRNYSIPYSEIQATANDPIQYLSFDKTDNTRLIGSTTSGYLMSLDANLNFTVSNTKLTYITQDYYNGKIIAIDSDYSNNSLIYVVDKNNFQILGKFRANIIDYDINVYNYNMMLSNASESYKINIAKYCN